MAFQTDAKWLFRQMQNDFSDRCNRGTKRRKRHVSVGRKKACRVGRQGWFFLGCALEGCGGGGVGYGKKKGNVHKRKVVLVAWEPWGARLTVQLKQLSVWHVPEKLSGGLANGYLPAIDDVDALGQLGGG